MTICLNGHNDSILGLMSRLAAIILARLSISISFRIRSKIIIVQDASLRRGISLVTLISKKVIAALVNGVERIFRIRHIVLSQKSSAVKKFNSQVI